MPNNTTHDNIVPNVTPLALESAPTRALIFLRCLATQPAIRTIMEQAGYSTADHAEGWDLLMATAGYVPPHPPPVSPLEKGIREIQAWIRPALLRAQAALRRIHP